MDLREAFTTLKNADRVNLLIKDENITSLEDILARNSDLEVSVSISDESESSSDSDSDYGDVRNTLPDITNHLNRSPSTHFCPIPQSDCSTCSRSSFRNRSKSSSPLLPPPKSGIPTAHRSFDNRRSDMFMGKRVRFATPRAGPRTSSPSRNNAYSHSGSSRRSISPAYISYSRVREHRRCSGHTNKCYYCGKPLEKHRYIYENCPSFELCLDCYIDTDSKANWKLGFTRDGRRYIHDCE